MSRDRGRGQPRKSGPVSFETVRELALALPGAEEGTSYRTPAFRVGGKLFARLHQDGESLVVKIDLDQRRMRMKADPQTYYITDHYQDSPMMLVRLANADPEDLRELLEESWRLSAPGRWLDAYDGQRDAGRRDAPGSGGP